MISYFAFTQRIISVRRTIFQVENSRVVLETNKQTLCDKQTGRKRKKTQKWTTTTT